MARLSILYLGSEDIFLKKRKKLLQKQKQTSPKEFLKSSMAGDGSPAGRRSPAVMYGRSAFVITFFQKLSPGSKNSLDRRATRFSTICAKNQALNPV